MMPGYDFDAPGPAFVRFTNSAQRHNEDGFLRSLARANATSRDSPPDGSVAVSGAFAALPAELIDAICVELLIGSSRNRGQPRTARHYTRFLLACRWVRASVSRRVALEAKCIHLVQRSNSLPILPPEASYVEYAKTAIRSRIELDMLYRYVKDVPFHCVDPTAECCRGLRAALNDDWCQAPASALFPLDSLGAEALRGCTGRRATVVAPTRAQLLCATTPGGALLCNDERVWSVTSTPAEEFAPGYELATAFSTPRKNKRSRVWAAAQGKRTAVCESPVPNPNDDDDDDVAAAAAFLVNREAYYSLRIFDDGRLIAETTMSDQGAIYMGAGEPHTMWIHNGAVWLLWLHHNNDVCPYVRLVRIHPHEANAPEREWFTLVYQYENVVSMSVATDAGHVAILYSIGTEVMLYFFDVDGLSGRHVPVSRVFGGGDWLWGEHRHQITLSPDGMRMVLLDRSPDEPLVVPYVRDYTHGSLEHHRWRATTTCAIAGDGVCAMKFGHLRHTMFTPCGRRFLAFFVSTVRAQGGVLEVEIVGLMDGVNRHFVMDYSRFTPVRAASSLPNNACWSSDGLFVQTWDTGGVLRLGLVE